MKRKSLLNFISKTGYKRNSPHVRRPMNLIPSGKITMKGVDFPLRGIDNLGNEQIMYPGIDYIFPGDYVLELPMMQPGGSNSNIKRVGKRKDEINYIDSVLNANKNLDWVQRLYGKNQQSIKIPGKRGRATHYMESADNRVYPTVVRRLPNSNLEYLGNNAYDYADSTKSFIRFPSDAEAKWFAENYKKGTAVLPKKQDAGQFPVPNYITVPDASYVYPGRARAIQLQSPPGTKPVVKAPPPKTQKRLMPAPQAQKRLFPLSEQLYRIDPESTMVSRINFQPSYRYVGNRVWLPAHMKTIEEMNAEELARRKQAIQASQTAASKPFMQRITPENIALETGAIGDKFRFFPDEPASFIDEWLNPLKMIGDLSSGLARVPLNIKQGNYLQAGLGIAAPIAVGAFAGIGAKNTTQFLNNAFNPLAGTGQLLKTKTPLKNTYKQLPGSSNVAPVVNATPAPWSMQEMPGLHLKSTMSDGAVSKIVEPKTGLINVEQALGIIGKESGGADKVALIKQGLGETIPKKMDYNQFRKVVQDQLIPLERQFATHSSNYGIPRLGYYKKGQVPKYSESYLNQEIDKINKILKSSEKGEIKIPNSEIESLKNKLADYQRHLSGKSFPEYIENQTLILSNKGKFGRGSGAHGNPDETLGHIHFLRDAETPDVLTVTQIQSDAFQGTHRIMPKNAPDASKAQYSLQRMEELQNRNKSILNKMKTEGVDEAGLPVQDYQIKQFEDIVKAQEQSNLFKKAEIENFTQKQLLDKNHQERYLQELVDYAGKRGDINKLRLPTFETAIKVQGYTPATTAEKVIDKYNKLKGTDEWNVLMSTASDADKVKLERVLKGEIKGDIYSQETETILRKYTEQPKTIKKLFGQDAKIVTDSKGNTWYEFDIPESFKGAKGEIKAFSTGGMITPPAIIGTGALQEPSKKPRKEMIRDPFRFYQVPPPPPTYFAGTLPTVNVRSTYPDDYVANAVRQGGSRFFGTVGRFMGQPQRDMMELFTGVEQTPSEYFEIENPYAAFAVDAVTDPVNLIGGAALTRFARLGMAPLRQGIKSSGRYLTRGYGNLSTGNSFIPRAWRSPIENIDQPMSQKFFDETIDVSKLSKEDKKLWAKYQKDSGPYKIPGTKEYDEMQDLISRSSIAFPEGMPLTRMIGFENMTSPINKSGILDVSSPTSFSTGRGQEIIGNIAGEGNRRVVIPPKYAKKLEGYFGKNPYAESLDQPLDLLRQEKEVVGSGFKLKQIGKVKNELGGYDYIMKPINLSKPKQLPGSRTSNSIMRDSKGQIQFLDNETYQDALKTGILNVRDYILDPRYRNVVEANQQLANRLNMNRVLPIQKEMGNVGLYDARVAKVNQPLYIQDPRPLETKIIQGTNDGVQAQYSRNLDGSGYLTIPRLHDKAKIIKNVEHEALHHVYPNLGEGFPSFTPLETAKAKAVFKSSAELRKIEQANKIPLWYLDDVDELVPNSFDLAKDLGIKRFQMYPGKERFKQILDSYQGNKKFIKDALKLNTSRDYKRAWDMLSGVRVGYAGAAYLGYEGLQGLQEQQVPKQKFGGVLPKAQDGEYLHPQNPYGFATEDDAIYSGVADPVFYEKGNFTPRLTQQDVLDLVAGKKVVPTEKQPGYSKEDLLNAYREARDRFDKQEEELAKVGSEFVSLWKKSYSLFENLHRRNPKYPYNYYWFPAANTSSVLQQDDLKELGKIEEELNKEGLSDKESAELKVKREKIMNRSYNPMMDFVNYHTNQSTIRPDGKRYISPELAMESIFRNSGRRMERQAGAYYSDRDFSISKKLGKFDYEKFKTDSGYRKEVTDEYLKIPGVRESLEEYMKSPLEYEPSFSGRFLPPKRGSGSYFYPRSNTINLAYHELIDDIRNEGKYSSENRINHSGTTMPMILDHEYSHLENEYLKNVAQKLLDEYTPRPDPIGRRIAEDDFYRKLNEVYPQQRLLEGLARNSAFVNSPLSENPRIKQEEGDNTDWLSVLKKTKNPDAILGSPIDIPRVPFARIHEESSQELMSDIKAIQEYMTANPGYKYDYTDPNSFFTKKMFNKLINDDNVNKTLSFYRIFDRYLHDFDKLEKLMNLTSNEKSTPSYLSGFSDVSHSKNGGELLNGYKRYIMGDYKPEEEKNLKNTYDKLNRNYYKKAKESGMTAPNYIMSML